VTPASEPRGPRTGPAAVVFLVALALLVAACGTTATRTAAAPSGSAAASPSGEPTPTDESSGAPTEEPTGQATEPPTGEPSAEPTETPVASGSPGGASACSGNDGNRDFFVAVARAVTWDVYCAVLPAGWFVDAGEFRLAGGGKMTIAYKGPGGARLEVREGTYCAGVDGCIPAGPDAGTTPFGDRLARLVDAGGGAWLVVAEGGDVNWEAKGTGLDAAVVSGLAAAFAKVGE
jgi:hypothetical protein